MTSQPAGGTQPAPGHSRTREPGPSTPGPRPPRRQADTHQRNLGRRRGVRRRPAPAADLHPGNSHSVSIGYFRAHGLSPLGVALLLAAVLGVLLTVIPGTARIIQLGIIARRHRRHDTKPPASPQLHHLPASTTTRLPPTRPACRHVRRRHGHPTAARTAPAPGRGDSGSISLLRQCAQHRVRACPARHRSPRALTADGDTATAGAHRLRWIEALDQHIGLGMRQRLLPCWHAQ
jgi:hypothetical protein